ncbi:MAG TPA: DUF2934 domain-containing protein [Candidatus Sulfotelmatobacter sp.]|jgi:hypothetical protein|nr:DUF2934 domain-containing protein [Candidatus Sulfotelmatobacter sp.]
MNAAANSPQPWPTTAVDPQEAIRRRAEEIYVRNGRIPGRDAENWAQAEQEILQELSGEALRKTAIVVRVNGEEYVGEYDPASADGYVPGEFGTGASVPVRFHAGKMLVLRPNGKVLETKIVKKNGINF